MSLDIRWRTPTDLRGLELVLNATVGDRYRVVVRQRAEGVVVGLRRRSEEIR